MAFLIPASAKSWVNYGAASHFPIQNIPFGVMLDGDAQPAICTRVGEHVINLSLLASEGVLPEYIVECFDLSSLCVHEDFEGFGNLRKDIYGLLRTNNPTLRDNKPLRELAMLPADVPMLVPMEIGAFVDFYSGINHARNVGKMFRPDSEPLLPNYKEVPIGYNGRASSVFVSGEPIHRPKGQLKGPNDPRPILGPSKELDFELELGIFLAQGTDAGDTLSPDQAYDFAAGMVLVNDWSARDIQRWEYQPLGPFLAKSFATSISPWMVTMDALAPFRCASKHQKHPEPLPYLAESKANHFPIRLEVWLQSKSMTKAQLISKTTADELYWSMAQQLAHQSSNGTPLEPGDLYASGTISGTEKGTFGSMLELTWKGAEPIKLEETGEERKFLEEGDTVTFTGWLEGDGFNVGFGHVSATVG